LLLFLPLYRWPRAADLTIDGTHPFLVLEKSRLLESHLQADTSELVHSMRSVRQKVLQIHDMHTGERFYDGLHLLYFQGNGSTALFVPEFPIVSFQAALRMTITFLFIARSLPSNGRAGFVFHLGTAGSSIGRRDADSLRQQCYVRVLPSGALCWSPFGTSEEFRVTVAGFRLQTSQPYQISMVIEVGFARLCIHWRRIHKLTHREQSPEDIELCTADSPAESAVYLHILQLSIGAAIVTGGKQTAVLGLSDAAVGFFHIFERSLTRAELKVRHCKPVQVCT
jgi:hypothetical protein